MRCAADEIAHFVNSLAYRIATFPAEAIALAKQAVGMADAGLEDEWRRGWPPACRPSHRAMQLRPDLPRPAFDNHTGTQPWPQ
jgi:hypothetical protein